jgi:hypothetical protein
VLREEDLLGPLERLNVLIVCRDEGVDLIADPPRCGEAGAGQGFAGEDRKLDLYLVQPGGMGRGEMKNGRWDSGPANDHVWVCECSNCPR